MDQDLDTTQEADSVAKPSTDTLADRSLAEQSLISKTQLTIQLLGADPIAGLDAQVILNGKVQLLYSDSEGFLPDLEAYSGAHFELAVKCLDGSFKTIDKCTVPGGTCIRWQYLSPSPLVIDINPDMHQGAPGNLEDRIPQPVPTDAGEQSSALDKETSPNTQETEGVAEPTATTHIDPSSSTPTHSSIQPARPAPTKAAAPMPAAPTQTPKTQAPKPALIAPHIQGKETAAQSASRQETGRDSDGHPFTIIATKVKDWWNSWRLPDIVLRDHPSAQPANLDQRKQAPANNSAFPSLPTSQSASNSASKVSFTQGMPAKAQALINFAEEQTTYTYGKSGSLAVAQTMLNGTFKHTTGERQMPPYGDGQCYQYVRLALLRTGITANLLALKSAEEVQRSASRAGPALLAEGFVDVTGEVPDARWAATGDVIVYEWSRKTWEARKTKWKSKDLPNHGHIDIRSEISYISDFIPASNHPKWIAADKSEISGYRAEYINIRIYRKYYNPLPVSRIRAFLRCLRDFECQGILTDEDRYRALNKPLPNSTSNDKFFSFNVHPWETVPESARGKATAAGAYQILHSTWREMIDRQYFPDLAGRPLFSPVAQDRMAVLKIEDRQALHLVRAGDIVNAVDKLKGEWTSLPGGSQNAHRRMGNLPMDIKYFKALFSKYVDEEQQKFHAS